jgi:GTP cyclohydrolase I
MLNTQFKEKTLVSDLLLDDQDHPFTKLETPLREDAFDLNDDEKIGIIEKHFKEIMLTLGLDLQDESLRGTPKRVAKMYVKELFSGLNPENEPAMTLFSNEYNYNEMLVEKNIQFYSCCEHHFVPIVGKVHVAYISNGKVIGLSKLHRIVNHFARRPQVQERMTIQIGNAIKNALMTEDVAVFVDADHHRNHDFSHFLFLLFTKLLPLPPLIDTHYKRFIRTGNRNFA